MEKNNLNHIKLLMIGGSSGSIDALLKILPGIKSLTRIAIIIVLHRRNVYDSSLSDLFASRTKLPIVEADEKEPIKTGVIYIAPADYHLLIERDFTFSLDVSEKINYSRPSIDVSFETAAAAYGNTLACLLLSGANADGVDGLKTVKHYGGITLAQDPKTADVPYMPQTAINNVVMDFVLPTEEIAGWVNKWLG